MRNSALLSVLVVCTSCFAAAPNFVPEGTRLETAAFASDVSLQNGVDFRLSARSTSTIFHDHLVLEDGAVRVSRFNGYPVNVRELQIESANSSTQAIVRLNKGTVEVASLGGSLNVTDGGAMLTRVVAGTRISFQQNAAPAHKPLPSDQHTMLWVIGVTAVAALVIGLTAASQGKSI